MLSKFLMGARYDIDIFIEGYEWLGELWFFISKIFPYIMIVMGTAAAIVLIVLGVKASKQETPDKREKMVRLVKRILVGVLVGEFLLAIIYVVNIFVPTFVLNGTQYLREAEVMFKLFI